MLNKRVDAAERHRVRDECAAFDETRGSVVAAGQLNRDERARAVELSTEQTERILTGQTREHHALDGRMRVQTRR